MRRAFGIISLLAIAAGCAHTHLAERPMVSPAQRSPASSPEGDFPIIKSIINNNVTNGSPNL